MKSMISVILLGLMLCAGALGQDKPQTKCPILGNKINKEFYEDHMGARVYFCCKGCKDRFKRNPDRFIRILMSQGVRLERAAAPQTKCPIMGGKINKEAFVDYKGHRIYFCCPGCDKTFNKDPEKYIRQMKAQGVKLEKIKSKQTQCPVMGGKINKDVFVDYKGHRIYFCCPGCDKTFNKDPEKYISKVKAQGVELEKVKTPQTQCPVMGGEINKDVFVDYKGHRIYFCCPGCDQTFNKDPEKYIKTMEAKGIALEPSPKKKD